MSAPSNPTHAEFVSIDPVVAHELRQEIARLWPLLGRHIAFHRRLVDVTHNVKAALLLSQSIYWTWHGRDVDARGGWFHKTADQWGRETGLSAKEQAHARDCLRQIAVLGEKRAGLPARLHFRIDRERLAAILSGVLDLCLDTWDWRRDRAAWLRVLGPSHAYHRVLVDVAGGVLPALLLSRGLTLSRARLMRTSDPWFTRVGVQWSDELGLSRREQEAARHDLVRLGLWEEHGGRGPVPLHARVRLDVLRERLVASSGMSER